MTTEHEASRTLVKSPPELWAECSDAGSLARHLGEFGEITITRLDPEITVAWEGERASGTVRIEPSGWGTKVTLTAETKLDEVKGAIEPHDESPIDTADAASGTGDESVNQGQLPTPPAEERDDATVEETLEDVDPGPGADSDQARARWRRLTARMRGLFGSVESPEKADPSPSLDAAEPVEVSEEPTADSIPLASVELAPEPDPAPDPEPDPVPDPELDPAPDPEPALPPDPEPAPAAVVLDAEAILTSALDSLGQAHHRPFSRA